MKNIWCRGWNTCQSCHIKSTYAISVLFIRRDHKIDLFLFHPFLQLDSTICILTQALISPLYILCCCASVLRFYLCASCLFKDRVWHFHGIWCRCDFIKQMCGLRQRWTGTNPAAALHRTAPCFPPTSADLGKMPRVQLKNLMPPHRHTLAHSPHPLLLMSREVPHTLISPHWEALLFSYMKS